MRAVRFLACLTASVVACARPSSSLAFVGWKPIGLSPPRLNRDHATRRLNTPLSRTFQHYLSDASELDRDLEVKGKTFHSRTEEILDAGVRNAWDDVNFCSDNVHYYSMKIEEIESRSDFTGSEPRYIIFKERLKEANEELTEARAFHFELRAAATSAARAETAKRRGRNFVATIMKDDILVDVPNSDGMSVMRDIPDLVTGVHGNVVIRNITDKFWQTCIDRVETGLYRVCAMGTPGIGKTTATSYLIRVLLKSGKRVVYLVRSREKTRWYYDFTPTSDNNVDVAVYPEETCETRIPRLDDPSTYYIVDPGDTQDSCDPGEWFLGKAILVSSPDEEHWGGSEFRKGRNGIMGMFLCFPIWTLDELKQASAVLGPQLTEEEIHERYRQFGGIPGAIFRPANHDGKELLAAQDRAFSYLTYYWAESMHLRKFYGMDSFGPNAKKSALMGFQSWDFGWDRIIISELVYEKVCKKFMATLWYHVQNSDGGKKLFETYTRCLMVGPQQTFHCRPCGGAKDRDQDDETDLAILGGCTSIRMAGDIVTAAKKHRGVLFHPANPNYPLIDFIYQDDSGVFHAFIATVAETHDAMPCDINNLEKGVGDAKNKLRLYYLVPGKMYRIFVTKPVEHDVICRVYHVLVPKPEKESQEKEEIIALSPI